MDDATFGLTICDQGLKLFALAAWYGVLMYYYTNPVRESPPPLTNSTPNAIVTLLVTSMTTCSFLLVG